MLRALLLVVVVAVIAALLNGCALSPGCYVGLSIFPPGPFIHCGVDAAPEEDEDKGGLIRV